METIQLSNEDIQKAKEFAHLRATACTSVYKFRGGFKYVDILCGALGELAVYNWLKPSRKSLTPPDFTLHDIKDKSYSPDLADRGRRYHIKSQTMKSKLRYGASWLLQKDDPVTFSPHDRDWLVLTNVSLKNNLVEIHGMWKASELSCVWGECKVPRYSLTKVALYLKDLINEQD